MQEILLSDLYGLPKDQLGTMTLLGLEKAFTDGNTFHLVLKVDKRHLNTQGTVHGGILFSLCDQAVGTYLVYKKMKSVAMAGDVHFYRPAREGDVLTASVYERKAGGKTGVYLAELKNQLGKSVADCLITAMILDAGDLAHD